MTPSNDTNINCLPGRISELGETSLSPVYPCISKITGRPLTSGAWAIVFGNATSNLYGLSMFAL